MLNKWWLSPLFAIQTFRWRHPDGKSIFEGAFAYHCGVELIGDRVGDDPGTQNFADGQANTDPDEGNPKEKNQQYFKIVMFACAQN